MRKGFDGLQALVGQAGLNVYSGALFVFVSRRRDRAKLLTWTHGGFALYYKRLEKGRFHLPPRHPEERQLHLDPAQLAMLLDGIDLNQVSLPPRWQPPRPCL